MNPTVFTVAVIYFEITLILGLRVARREKNTSHNYFLAGHTLPWYAVSTALFVIFR